MRVIFLISAALCDIFHGCNRARVGLGGGARSAGLLCGAARTPAGRNEGSGKASALCS